jgi:hypothetical protein
MGVVKYMRASELGPHDPVDLFLKTSSSAYSLAEVRESLPRFAPETEIFFRLATRDDRADGLYIQFLSERPVTYSLAEFAAKLPKFSPETAFLAVFQKGRKNYCAPTLFISQLVPIPKRVR